MEQRSICRGPDAERNIRLSKCKLECSDISVAYVVVVFFFCCFVAYIVVVVVVVVIISLGTMVQFPVQHSSQEVKTQLAELATRRGGQSSCTFKKKMEEEKRSDVASKAAEQVSMPLLDV